MATAQSLIDKALGALGRLAEGDTLAAGSALNRALEVLNGMLDAWNTSKMSVPYIAQATKTLTPGTGSYTVLTGGEINVVRPTDIEDTSFIRWENTDFELRKLGRDQYNAISDKSRQGMPEFVYYDPITTTARLYFYPVPDQAYVAYIDYMLHHGAFATAATDIALKPGYENAMWKCLAEELWLFYPNPLVYNNIVRAASIARMNVQEANVRVPVLRNQMRRSSYDGINDR